MCCSLIAAIREIYFFHSCFWAARYFTGRRLNLRVTWANNKRNRSSMAQHDVHWSTFLPSGSLAEQGEVNLVVVSVAGAAVSAGVCGVNRLGRRSKMWFSGFQSSLLRAEDRGASGWAPVCKGCFLWRLYAVLSSVSCHKCVFLPLCLQFLHHCSVLCRLPHGLFHTPMRFSIPCSLITSFAWLKILLWFNF